MTLLACLASPILHSINDASIDCGWCHSLLQRTQPTISFLSYWTKKYCRRFQKAEFSWNKKVCRCHQWLDCMDRKAHNIVLIFLHSTACRIIWYSNLHEFYIEVPTTLLLTMMATAAKGIAISAAYPIGTLLFDPYCLGPPKCGDRNFLTPPNEIITHLVHPTTCQNR